MLICVELEKFYKLCPDTECKLAFALFESEVERVISVKAFGWTRLELTFPPAIHVSQIVNLNTDCTK